MPPPNVSLSPFQLTQAEFQHRGHAVIEQVFADLVDGPLAHLPSSPFPANAACWLQLAATAHALTGRWAPWPRPDTPWPAVRPSAPN